MARARAIQQSEYPYTITGRCINKEWFNLPMDEVWNIFCEELKRTNKELNLQIHAFVLMSNHFHLIASTPNANISQCMLQFMTNTSRRLTARGNRINQTYGGRHFKCILQHQNYFLNAYKYLYRNPVEAGICERVEDYPYSTLQFFIDPQKKCFPIENDQFFKDSPTATLEWLNRAPPPEKWNCVRLGLKHTYFKASKNRKTNAPIMTTMEIL